MQSLIFTKFRSWSYESEWRCYLKLDPETLEGENYFKYFSDEIALREVIVGAASDVTSKAVTNALDGLEGVEPPFKTRLAFRSFRVVKNRKSSLWK